MAKRRWDKSQNHHYYSYYNTHNEYHNEYHNDYYNDEYNNKCKSRWVVKSEVQTEINSSNGTILYCQHNATSSKDILQIKQNESIPAKPDKNCLRIIACGCTHELHRDVYFPNGDILIHAGDVCNWRRYNHTEKIYKTPYDTWSDFASIINKLQNRSKDNFKYGMYIIPGNHDVYLEQNEKKIKSLLHKNNIKLLVNESTKINVENNRDLTIFGSPISWYRGKPSNAYQIHRHQHKDLWIKDGRSESVKQFDDDFIAKYFYHSNNKHGNNDKLDILITHGPPAGYGDCEVIGRGTGSYQLLDYIKKEKPKLFICCDFHGSAEYTTHGYGINFVNFKDENHDTDEIKTDDNDKKEMNASNKCCIIMNVAMAHQPARYMRSSNIRRGVTIIDIKFQEFE